MSTLHTLANHVAASLPGTADVLAAPDPDQLLLRFLTSSHEAAAATGHWPEPDRGAGARRTPAVRP